MSVWDSVRIFGYIVGLLLFIIATSSISPSHSSATDLSPWLNGTPTLDNKTDLPPGMLAPITSNRDCINSKMIYVPARLPLQPEQSKQTCIVNTGYGAIDKNGYLQRSGTNVAGFVYNWFGGSAYLEPIPRTDTALVVTGSGVYGSYLATVPTLDNYLTTTIWQNGSVTHNMSPQTPRQILSDRSGQALQITHDSMAFSSNGNWLIGDVPGIGFIRINLNTREVVPFTDPTDFRVAIGAYYRTAISPDGRYAVIATAEFGTFKLYDLSTCGPVPDRITAKVPCQSRNILPTMQQRIPGYFAASSIRFRGNLSLEMYVGSRQNNAVTVSHLFLTAEGQTRSDFEYLGMGDSFASGEGAFAYKAGTDANGNKCHLSVNSYPYLLGKKLSMGEYESIACSGSVINDVDSLDDKYKPRAKRPQGLSNEQIIGSYNPGYIPQHYFVFEKKPNIITISMVGNDIGFGGIVQRCMSAADTCYGKYEERLEKVREIDSKFNELVNMYDDLRSGSGPNTKIYVIGYPKVANPEGSCAVNVRLNKQELQFANDLVDYLDTMVERAAKRAGVFYVDTSHAFDDHRLCDNSWSLAMNGFTSGKDKLDLKVLAGPVGNESYHPNAYGHGLFTDTILTKTNNLSVPMPDPQLDITQPQVTSGIPILDNAPKGNRPARQLHTYNEMGQDSGARGKQWSGNTSGSIRLQPGTKATVEIHSTPTTLGSYTVDPVGALTFTTTLPPTIDPGFHTIHILGKNTAGEDVDIEKVIYVSAFSEDYDADGVMNELDPCPINEQSGQDSDKDLIDDACDDAITEPPTIAVPPQETPTEQINPANSVDHPEPNNPDPEIIIEVTPPAPVVTVEVTDSAIPSDPIPVFVDVTPKQTDSAAISETLQPTTTPEDNPVNMQVPTESTTELVVETSPEEEAVITDIETLQPAPVITAEEPVTITLTEREKELPLRESDPWASYIGSPPASANNTPFLSERTEQTQTISTLSTLKFTTPITESRPATPTVLGETTPSASTHPSSATQHKKRPDISNLLVVSIVGMSVMGVTVRLRRPKQP